MCTSSTTFETLLECATFETVLPNTTVDIDVSYTVQLNGAGVGLGVFRILVDGAQLPVNAQSGTDGKEANELVQESGAIIARVVIATPGVHVVTLEWRVEAIPPVTMCIAPQANGGFASLRVTEIGPS